MIPLEYQTHLLARTAFLRCGLFPLNTCAATESTYRAMRLRKLRCHIFPATVAATRLGYHLFSLRSKAQSERPPRGLGRFLGSLFVYSRNSQN
jgi:hypothetical protein